MPKIKTHKGAQKRFKLSAKGKVRFKKACMQHNLSDKTSKSKRSKRALSVLTHADSMLIKRIAPSLNKRS